GEDRLETPLGVAALAPGLGVEGVVLEQAAQQQAGGRLALGERGDERVDPAVEALEGRALARERRLEALVELREQPLEHGQVELGLAAEVVEERRLAEPRRLGDLAHADALEAAPGEQHLGDVEDL